MPEWSKQTGTPSLYGWINIADLRAALPQLVTRFQNGGSAPTEPGPGGVDADGVELPGNPVPWEYPNLTESKLKRFFKRHTCETKAGHALIELEFREWRRLPRVMRDMFGTAAELNAHPLSQDRNLSDTNASDLVGFGEPLGPKAALD